MSTTLLSAGLACLIAAIAGGGLKAFGIEIPVLQSIRRQLALGVLGVILIVLSQMPSWHPIVTPTSPVAVTGSTGGTGASAHVPVASPRLVVVKLSYDGEVDVMRQPKTITAHTPNNDTNRGPCPNEVGLHDGKWCTSRTNLSLVANAPLFYKNASTSCSGAGCAFSTFSTPSISEDGLTVSASIENWGAVADATLSAEQWEHLPATVCGSGETVRVAPGETFVLTVQKQCVGVATIRWTLLDGAHGAASVGQASLTGPVSLQSAPLDRGTELLYTYRVAR